MKLEEGTHPPAFRLSVVVRRLRADGADSTADKIEQHASHVRCPVHGPLPDPVVGMVGERVLFACPKCSGSEVLARWEAEGADA